MRLPRFARRLARALAAAPQPKPASRFRPRLESLEGRELPATYVSFNITNNSQLNGGGLANGNIYVFMTQENINTTWTIDPTTGIATANTAGTLAPTLTLAQLATAGGAIQVDSSLTVASARVYLSNSPNAVTVSASGAVSGPTASTAQFYYDFFEFDLNSQPGILNVDTTQVDQLGIPLTLQTTPNDPNYIAGSGVISTLDRQTLIADFQAMATGSLAPFADCVMVAGGNPNAVLRLLNPKDVINGQLNAINLEGTIATSGTPGNWQATFTITGPGPVIPNNGTVAVGMTVSGPLIPAGTTISSLPGFPTGNTVVMTSTAQTNPFTATSNAVQLFFFEPPTTALATYFDAAIDSFFTFYKNNPNTLQVEQNSGGTNVIYTGNVVEVQNVPDINGGQSTYTALQFTGNGETYNIYYPFFTTNSPAGKTTPFGAAVPAPPAWWAPPQGLKFFEPPSSMVFSADGVFADNTQQAASAPGSPNATVLGAIENVVATALARGYATTWQFLTGTVSNSLVNGAFPTTATVTLAAGGTTAGLTNTMYMSSFQIANVPMTPNIPAGPPVSTFTVNSPLPIPPTAQDLLTFSQFYPAGGTWSAFANFLHNGAGYDITIDGRAYALPFDDQGGFSSDLNAATSTTTPASVSIIMGPWAPKSGTARMVGRSLVVTGNARPDDIVLRRIANGRVRVIMNGTALGVFAPTRRIVVHGLGGRDFIDATGIANRVTIYGGAGHDVVFGGLKGDYLNGGSGNDELRGQGGRDQLVGGSGRNRVVQ